jgi:hypothetical protein
MGRRNGSSMVIPSYNGNLLVQIRFYGFMENVRTELHLLPFSQKMAISHLQPVQGRVSFGMFVVLPSLSENSWNWSVPLSSRTLMTCANEDWPRWRFSTVTSEMMPRRTFVD